MNFKFAIAASAVMAFAGILTTVGCGGDACTKAGDQVASCLNVTTSASTSATPPACEGATLCNAECINAATCDQIKDLLSGMPTDKSKPLVDCEAKCTPTK